MSRWPSGRSIDWNEPVESRTLEARVQARSRYPKLNVPGGGGE